MLFCPLCSGSSGNSTFVEAGDCRILIDAGVTAKRIEALLGAIGIAPESLTAILITHEHSDHIQGVRVLSRKYDLPVYAGADCWAAIKRTITDLPARNIRVFEPDQPFLLGDVSILPFSTPHDSAHAVGYTITHAGKKCSVMTDIGCVTQHMIDVVAESDILLIEANHDVDMLKAGSYPYALKQRILSSRGHLCNEDSGNALVKLFARGVHNVILGHLSKENNTRELALVTVESVLESAGILEAMHVIVAERDRPCGVYEIQ